MTSPESLADKLRHLGDGRMAEPVGETFNRQVKRFLREAADRIDELEKELTDALGNIGYLGERIAFLNSELDGRKKHNPMNDILGPFGSPRD
jgi:hypothetical protein